MGKEMMKDDFTARLILTGEREYSITGGDLYLCEPIFDSIGAFREAIAGVWGRICEIPTGDERTAVYFSVRRLLSVTYQDGRLGVEFFYTEADIEAAIGTTMTHYKRANGIEYDIQPDLFVIFQHPLLDDIK